MSTKNESLMLLKNPCRQALTTFVAEHSAYRTNLLKFFPGTANPYGWSKSSD